MITLIEGLLLGYLVFCYALSYWFLHFKINKNDDVEVFGFALMMVMLPILTPFYVISELIEDYFKNRTKDNE